MKLIPLTKGFSAAVDDDDFPIVSLHKWYAQPVDHTVYAARRDADGHLVYMHRQINGTPKGVLTDHRDGDGLNNTRGNLRDATGSQNQMNKRAKTGCASSLKGVWKNTHGGRKKCWRAGVRVGGKITYLGYFHTEEEAHAAYVAGAKAAFGDFFRASEESQS